MIVVADSSPLIVLVKIEHIQVLPALFGRIVIPDAVWNELINSGGPQMIRDYYSNRPEWLEVQEPAIVRDIHGLHRGEIEAISLALELHADALLIDERKGYQAAVGLQLNAVGTVRVLERAAAEGMVDLREAFDRIKLTDFRVSPKLLEERLRLYLEGRNS